MTKTFYQMKVYNDESGMALYSNKFLSFHETECNYFCVEGFNKWQLSLPLKGGAKTILQNLKRMKVKVYKIRKSGSRIAFETEEQALRHLKMLKSRHIEHMERDIQTYKSFLSIVNEKQIKDFKTSFEYPEYSIREL